jgi:undecaprenyl-diphosphatase
MDQRREEMQMNINYAINKVQNYDLEGFRAINNLVPKLKPINQFMKIVARFGPALFLIPIGFAYPFSKRYQSEKHRQKLSQAVVGTILVYIFNTPLRRIVGRRRPYFTHSNVHRLDPIHHQPSLPSDHATVSFAVARVFRRESFILKIPTYILAGLISFARVYSGEHYPSDVLIGAAIGLEIETIVERNWDAIEDGIEAAVNSSLSSRNA